MITIPDAVERVLMVAFVFGIYEVFGYQAAVISALVIIISALSEIVQKMDVKDKPLTSDDLE